MVEGETTVYGRADSSAVSRVMWTLGELGAPVRRIDAGGAFGGTDTPAYRRLQPAGRIPAVVLADGTALWESNAIIRYLADADPQRRLVPDGRIERAHAEAWMDWSGAFASAVSAIRKAYKAPGAAQADIAAAVAGAEPALDVLEARLDGAAFVMGERFGVADLALGVWAHRLFRCPPEVPLPALPAMRAWRARLGERPAFRTHVEGVVSAGPQVVGAG